MTHVSNQPWEHMQGVRLTTTGPGVANLAIGHPHTPLRPTTSITNRDVFLLPCLQFEPSGGVLVELFDGNLLQHKGVVAVQFFDFRLNFVVVIGNGFHDEFDLVGLLDVLLPPVAGFDFHELDAGHQFLLQQLVGNLLRLLPAAAG